MPVLAYHFIFSAYGFWLPNDPRGSWSTTIRAFDLLKYGPATKVETTRSVAAAPHDRQLRLEAKKVLKHPPVRFTGVQARAIARGFTEAKEEHHYEFLALAILPDHVHLLVARHPRDLDGIAAHLKAKATRRMATEGLHPFADRPGRDGRRLPSPWARNYWAPFVRDPHHLDAAVRYVEANPSRGGLRPQRYRCVRAAA